MKPKALIVGGGSGLGKALLEIYEREGWETHNVGRDVCDLSDPAEVEKLAEDAAFINSGFALALFSAATADMGYIDEMDPRAFRHCMQVNFLSIITLFQALAKATPACRRFVFIHSGAADFLVPGFSPYSLSKRALRDYLYISQLENSFPDCRILQVWPGAVATDFARKIRIHGRYQVIKGTTPRQATDVAHRIHDAEKKRRKRLDLSPLAQFLGQLQALMPEMVARLVRLHPKLRRKT